MLLTCSVFCFASNMETHATYIFLHHRHDVYGALEFFSDIENHDLLVKLTQYCKRGSLKASQYACQLENNGQSAVAVAIIDHVWQSLCAAHDSCSLCENIVIAVQKSILKEALRVAACKSCILAALSLSSWRNFKITRFKCWFCYWDVQHSFFMYIIVEAMILAWIKLKISHRLMLWWR